MSTENMEAPEIYSGKVGVEIVPDMRKLRSFAKDFIAPRGQLLAGGNR